MSAGAGETSRRGALRQAGRLWRHRCSFRPARGPLEEPTPRAFKEFSSPGKPPSQKGRAARAQLAHSRAVPSTPLRTQGPVTPNRSRSFTEDVGGVNFLPSLGAETRIEFGGTDRATAHTIQANLFASATTMTLRAARSSSAWSQLASRVSVFARPDRPLGRRVSTGIAARRRRSPWR